MSCALTGVEYGDLGASLGRAAMDDITCVRCLDAMLGRHPAPKTRLRWKFWVSATAGGDLPDPAPGSSYVAGASGWTENG